MDMRLEPAPIPVFVLTHRVAEEWVYEASPFAFVTEGVEAAVEKAKAVAGDKGRRRGRGGRGLGRDANGRLRGDGKRELGAPEGLRQRHVRLGVLRPLEEPLREVVLDGRVRQPH
jgi:hypothetical protein